MSSFTGRLDQVEAKLQIFIESKLARLSPRHSGQDHLARRLVAAMRASAISTGDGILLAPDRFTVLVNPAQSESLCDDPDLLVELAKLMEEVAKEAQLHFVQTPEVSIAPNDDVELHRVEIIARFSENKRGKTAELDELPESETPTFPQGAFLIVDGTEILVLDQPVVNIGRRSHNHLVIDDPRISREHAQIRASRGRFEIFDLDSTGGTFVNKKRVTQHLLHPGDVISLAGVTLIYGQETHSKLGDTKKLTPVNDKDKPTAHKPNP